MTKRRSSRPVTLQVAYERESHRKDRRFFGNLRQQVANKRKSQGSKN